MMTFRTSSSTWHAVWVPRFWLGTLVVLLFLVVPWNAINYDQVYLIPKVLWLDFAVFPSSLAVLYVFRDAFNKKARWVLTPLLLLAAWLSLASLVTGWSSNVTGAFDRSDGLLSHWIYIAVALAAFAWSSCGPRDDRSRLPVLLGWLAAVLSVIVVMQVSGLLGIIGGTGLGGVQASQTGGVMGNRGYMGGLLAMLLPFVLELGRRGWRLSPLVLITVFALGETWSRGPWIAAALAYICWLVLGQGCRVWTNHLAAFTAVAAVLLLPTQVRDLSGGKLVSDSNRITLYHGALHGIGARPLFGWGADGVLRATHTRSPLEVLRDLKVHVAPGDSVNAVSKPSDDMWAVQIIKADRTRVLAGIDVDKVHNEYLDYAVSYGVLAGLLFVWIWVAGLWHARREAASFAALLAYLIYLATWPEVIRFAPLAWALLGMALAHNRAAVSSRLKR